MSALLAKADLGREKALLLGAFALLTALAIFKAHPTGVYLNGLVLSLLLTDRIDTGARLGNQPMAGFIALQAVLLLFVYEFMNRLVWWLGEVALVSLAAVVLMFSYRRKQG